MLIEVGVSLPSLLGGGREQWALRLTNKRAKWRTKSNAWRALSGGGWREERGRDGRVSKKCKCTETRSRFAFGSVPATYDTTFGEARRVHHRSPPTFTHHNNDDQKNTRLREGRPRERPPRTPWTIQHLASGRIVCHFLQNHTLPGHLQ